MHYEIYFIMKDLMMKKPDKAASLCWIYFSIFRSVLRVDMRGCSHTRMLN